MTITCEGQEVTTAQTVVLYKSKIFSWKMYKVSFSDILLRV